MSKLHTTWRTDAGQRAIDRRDEIREIILAQGSEAKSRGFEGDDGRGCNPIGGRLCFTANPAIPAEAGIQAAAAVALPEGATVRETIQNQVLAERWIPAFEAVIQLASTALPLWKITPSRGLKAHGMAKEAGVEIAALLVDSNWITASFDGKTRVAFVEIVTMLVRCRLD